MIPLSTTWLIFCFLNFFHRELYRDYRKEYAPLVIIHYLTLLYPAVRVRTGSIIEYISQPTTLRPRLHVSTIINCPSLHYFPSIYMGLPFIGHSWHKKKNISKKLHKFVIYHTSFCLALYFVTIRALLILQLLDWYCIILVKDNNVNKFLTRQFKKSCYIKHVNDIS